MEITTSQYKRCDLIKITGRIDSSTAPQLSQKLNAINEEGRFKFVCDMADVEYISSSGLWVLINAQKTSKRYNRGEVVLACVPTKIKSALDLAGFVPFFKFFDDIVSAVGNF
jgi:anti-sigma B factor antagonist